MKPIIAICLTLITLFLFYSCKRYSWMVLENPEFPDAVRPIDLSADLLKKYSAGGVIIHPRIISSDGAMATQGLFVVFFSKMNTSVPSIKSLILSVDGVELEYGKQMVSESTSDWKLYPLNKPFYSCSLDGGPIMQSKTEILTGRIDLSLTVLIKKANGQAVTKKIDAYFLPKKRSYLE